VSLTVTAVNDAPAGTDNTVSTPLNTDYVFKASDFGFTDPNDSPANNFLAVKITTLATAGTLKYNNGTVTSNVTTGQFITVADINLGRLFFSPASGATGSPYATFTFQVEDDGGTANSGQNLDQSANTMSINVATVVSIAKANDGAEPGTNG